MARLTRSVDCASVELLDCSQPPTIDPSSWVRLAHRQALSWRHNPVLRAAGHDEQDLQQEQLLALVEARDTYDPARGQAASWAAVVMRRRLSRLVYLREMPKRRPTAPVCSMDTLVADGEMVNLHELVADENAIDALSSLELHERRHLVRQALDALPERDAEVLRRRARGDTRECIGRALGISGERVRQIETRALDALRRVLPA